MPITVLHLRNKETGQPYRKTLQYGYDRQQGIDRHMGMRLNGLPQTLSEARGQEIKEDLYACAFLRPNYPVPAIPTAVERTRNTVNIYQPYVKSPWIWCSVYSMIQGSITGRWHHNLGNRELM